MHIRLRRAVKIVEGVFARRCAWWDELVLYFLAGLIGSITATAAVGFNYLIDQVDMLAYGTWAFVGSFRAHHLFLLLIPAAGGLLVGLIGRFYGREATGHGVPEVMYAIVRRNCNIKLHVALARTVTAALTIGSGGSAGPEGPIIQIGAAIASYTGRFFRVVRHQMPVLIGCGAAAGIAAIFRAPIAGVLFVMEVFLRDTSFRRISPILIASVISSVVMTSMLGGRQAIFPLQDLTAYTFHWNELGSYIVLGFLCAVAGVSLIWLLNLTEDIFARLRIHDVFKPMLGGLFMGAIGLATVLTIRGAVRGEPIIFGKGYDFIGLCIGTASAERFAGFQLTVGVLFVLMIAKMAATALTLGSGGSGGVFAPSLFLGATIGHGFGALVQQSGLFADINVVVYSLVGMASMVAATTHAPMAAIVMLFEMTHNYAIILPVMFSCTVALLIARLFCSQSLETFRLQRDGVHFDLHAKTSLLRRSSVKDIMQLAVVTVDAAMSVRDIIVQTADEDVSEFVVLDETGHYHGLLCERELHYTLSHPETIPLLIGEDLAHHDVPAVSATDTLDKVLNLFSRLEVESLPVVDGSDSGVFVGMVSRAALMRRYMDELQNGD